MEGWVCVMDAYSRFGTVRHSGHEVHLVVYDTNVEQDVQQGIKEN